MHGTRGGFTVVCSRLSSTSPLHFPSFPRHQRSVGRDRVETNKPLSLIPDQSRRTGASTEKESCQRRNSVPRRDQWTAGEVESGGVSHSDFLVGLNGNILGLVDGRLSPLPREEEVDPTGVDRYPNVRRYSSRRRSPEDSR